MGDLKVGESFEDRVYIVDSSGAAKTGLAPTCTIIDESGNRTAGTVAEMASGWYKVTDFTPDAVGTWCLEWAVSGAYTIQYPNKLFKVGGGTLSDIETELTFQKQTDSELNQDNPTSAQNYDALSTTLNARIATACFKVTWSSQPNPLTVTITTSNAVFSVAFNNPVSGSWYEVIKDGRFGSYKMQVFGGGNAAAYILEDRSVQIQASITGGTVSNLYSRICYEKR